MTTTSIPSLTDDQLVTQFKTGADQRIFGEIYLRYHRNVLGVCLSIVKDRDTARDLAQDVMIKAIEKLGSLQHGFLLGLWIHNIARNESINFCKKRKKQQFVPAEEYVNLADEATDVEAVEAREQLFDGIGRAMNALNEDTRSLLTLKYLDNVSIKELQQKYALSESAVKMRLARARERVVEMYSQREASVC